MTDKELLKFRKTASEEVVDIIDELLELREEIEHLQNAYDEGYRDGWDAGYDEGCDESDWDLE